MNNKKEITAIIVCRAGSKRIKSKCLLKLNNETLIERKVKQLQQCKNIDRIIVGSDSLEMLDIAKKAGAEIVQRPEQYCNEEISSANDMIKNMCELIKTDIIVWSHCTNPLISYRTYDIAIEKFFEVYPKFDSLLSVINFQEHLWNDKKEPLNYNPYTPKHTPASKLPKYYMQDGGIFIQPYEQMKKNCYFFGKTPFLFEIPKEEFCDINEYRDYLIAKALIEDEER